MSQTNQKLLTKIVSSLEAKNPDILDLLRANPAIRTLPLGNLLTLREGNALPKKDIEILITAIVRKAGKEGIPFKGILAKVLAKTLIPRTYLGSIVANLRISGEIMMIGYNRVLTRYVMPEIQEETPLLDKVVSMIKTPGGVSVKKIQDVTGKDPKEIRTILDFLVSQAKVEVTRKPKKAALYVSV
jgi:hypothetical protein